MAMLSVAVSIPSCRVDSTRSIVIGVIVIKIITVIIIVVENRLVSKTDMSKTFCL